MIDNNINTDIDKNVRTSMGLHKISSKEVYEHRIGSMGSELGIGQRRQISTAILSSTSGSEEIMSYSSDKNYCSLFGFKSPCLSVFSSPVWYLVWYCFILFFQSMVVNGFINSSIASLEKRYKLSSKESSLIASMYDIGCMLVVLPVSFYGNKGHKPMWIGIGALIMGIGCFIYSSPQFISGSYEYTKISDEEIIMCSNMNISDINCDKKTGLSKLQNFKYLFYLGQFCLGIGGSPLYTLGVAYIEEINTKRVSALHVGISTAITAIGPAVGYITVGALLKVYVDITIPSKYMTPNETDIWVGAWWIGFVIAGFSFFLFSIPLIMYPQTVDLKEENESNKAKLVNSSDFSDIIKILKNIIHNLTYICVSIATTLTMLSLSGISTYGPKYFENIYGLTSSSATITVGLISVPTLATGALVGGILLHRYNWKLNGTLMFMAVTTLLSTPFMLIFLAKCEQTKMAGVNIGYRGSSEIVFDNISAPCNAHCHCSRNNFIPSCGADSIVYFSPCFAGCTVKETKKEFTVYNNCSCIDITVDGAQLTQKTCHTKLCFFFYITLFFLGAMLFFTYLRGAPSITATMRAVKKDEIAVSLGCQSIMSRIFGSIPGPVLFGGIIDLSCILWGKRCQAFGNCLKYDHDLLTKSFFLLMLIITALNAICFIIPRIILALKGLQN